MARVLVSLLLLSLLACDQTDDRTYANFDARLREMAGSSERQLLGLMGRIPDSSYQLADQTKVLQWAWDTSDGSPTCTPRRGGGGIGFTPIVVIGTHRSSPDRESCIVQWIVSKGTSQTYHWRGVGCRSVDLVSFPVP
jgi:hypothetical protein